MTITDLDDYPVHQTPEPLARPATSDPSFYDRYWFNGIDADAGFYLGIAFGVYPNLGVMDAAFSVVVEGEQRAFFASRRAPADRSETWVGPLSIEIVRPMRILRVRLGPNEAGLACDLTFHARTAPHAEPRTLLAQEGRVFMDTTRFLQFGRWEGEVRIDGRRLPLDPARVVATRDRSWGVRPVGTGVQAAPPRSEPGVFLLWSVNHFDDLCVHYGTLEDHDGMPLVVSGTVLPAHADPSSIPRGDDAGAHAMASMAAHLQWRPGTRWASRAELHMAGAGGERHTVEIEPLFRFHMKGIGYQHPEWRHGLWKGEEVTGADRWKLDELDPLAFENLHVQQICRVQMGERRGVGALEQLVIGSHAPSGLTGLLDGAPG